MGAKREKRLEVRVTESGGTLVEKYAAQAGLTTAEFIRMALSEKVDSLRKGDLCSRCHVRWDPTRLSAVMVEHSRAHRLCPTCLIEFESFLAGRNLMPATWGLADEIEVGSGKSR